MKLNPSLMFAVICRDRIRLSSGQFDETSKEEVTE